MKYLAATNWSGFVSAHLERSASRFLIHRDHIRSFHSILCADRTVSNVVSVDFSVAPRARRLSF